MARTDRKPEIRPMTPERFHQLKGWAQLTNNPDAKELVNEIERLQLLVGLHRDMYRDGVEQCRAEYHDNGRTGMPERCQRPAGHRKMHGLVRDDDSAILWSYGSVNAF